MSRNCIKDLSDCRCVGIPDYRLNSAFCALRHDKTREDLRDHLKEKGNTVMKRTVELHHEILDVLEEKGVDSAEKIKRKLSLLGDEAEEDELLNEAQLRPIKDFNQNSSDDEARSLLKECLRIFEENLDQKVIDEFKDQITPKRS